MWPLTAPTPHPRGRVEHGEGSQEMAALSVLKSQDGVAVAEPRASVHPQRAHPGVSLVLEKA